MAVRSSGGQNVLGQHAFARVPGPVIQRSVFDRSCGLKTTFSSGKLYPVFVDEALPGDTFEMTVTAFGRLSTLLHPIMENIFLDFFFFFVPNRLVWDNWVKMNGERKNPTDSVDFQVPTITPALYWNSGTLADYFGLPTLVTGTVSSCLPFRAYNLIWNEWFRDQNLQDSVVVNTDDGPDDPADYAILSRGKRHDYFTSCLPSPQKGDAIALPLGTTAPVIPDSTVSPRFESVAGGNSPWVLRSVNAAAQPILSATPTASGELHWERTGLLADLSAATAATINQLRESFQIQRLLERDARGGTRYTEILRSHFGVESPDQRLQRPEYLGGGSVRVGVQQVASTTYNTANTLQLGDLGAYGLAVGQPGRWRKSFDEHGFVIGLVASRADLNYQQGLERMWSRQERFDFYWPALAHLGEQAVLNKEIFQDGSDSLDEEVFGYQERFAEYRYKPSRVTGLFRSNHAQSLDSWHLSQEFADRPLLNGPFIVEDPPMSRVLAVSEATEPAFLLDCFFAYRCARPLPVFGVPGMIDHF